jgi:ribosomal protein L29
MLTIQELRTSTIHELNEELSKTRKELLKVRISVRTRHEKGTDKVQKTKRYIAQILTILKEAMRDDARKAEAKAVAGSTKKIAEKSTVKTVEAEAADEASTGEKQVKKTRKPASRSTAKKPASKKTSAKKS